MLLVAFIRVHFSTSVCFLEYQKEALFVSCAAVQGIYESQIDGYHEVGDVSLYKEISNAICVAVQDSESEERCFRLES